MLVPATEFRGEDLSAGDRDDHRRLRADDGAVPRKEDQHADHCAAWFFLADALDRRRRVCIRSLDTTRQLHRPLLLVAVRRRSVRGSTPPDRAERRRIGMDARPADRRRRPQIKRAALRRYETQMRRDGTGFSKGSLAATKCSRARRSHSIVDAAEPPQPVLRRTTYADRRLESLDVFRGVTIAAMILVSTPGTWNAVYTPLDHAAWNGWTPTDLVFPFLLFAMGAAVPFALGATPRRATGRSAVMSSSARALLLFALGLVLNAIETTPPIVWATFPIPACCSASRSSTSSSPG